MNATLIDETLNAARAAETTTPHEAVRLYSNVLKHDRTNLTAHNALERLKAHESYGRWMLMNCVIDERDDIFKFFAAHPESHNPFRDYLSDGWRTLSELLLLLEALDRPLLKMNSVLEFAAGFGRFTRHLTKAIPGKVTCSDVLPGSNAFVAREFGVHTFESTHDPRALQLKPEYDLIFVLSLFTHLPANMWTPWLQCLERGLAPGGLLVFTTHNEEDARIRHRVSFDASELHFIPTSESPSIDGETYGTIFTTRRYVEEAVLSALGHKPLLIRERCFWEGQDAVVVARA
jgi:SAM-dependent methyltransferase